MIIDAHVHIGRIAQFPRSFGEPEEIVHVFKEANVDYGLVSSLKSIYLDPIEGNEELIKISQRYKEILPMAVINPWYPEEALNYLGKVKEKSFVGVKLHPLLQDYDISSPLAEPILRECEKRGISILSHSSDGCSKSAPRLIGKVAEKFPKLTLVIGHAGMFSSPDAPEVAKDYPNVFLEVSVCYEMRNLERTLKIVGADKIMFGSDVPFHHPSLMITRIKLMQLSKVEEEKILSGTARKVFKLIEKKDLDDT